MLRRPSGSLCSLFVATLLAAACAPRPDGDGAERILLVVVDTLRRDYVGAYGGPPTPIMDSLAARGTLFTDSVASYHQTTMSMAALFTGRTPSLEMGGGVSLPWLGQTWCGMARLRRPDDPEDVCVPHSVETLAESLTKLGYETLGVTSNALLFRPAGYEQGFRRWIEVGPVHRRAKGPPRPRIAGLRSAERVNDAALLALDERESDRFFLYVHYMDVHDRGWVGVTYAEAVARVDRALGELLSGLRERGLLDGTSILVVSDHGEVLDDELPFTTFVHVGNPSFGPVLDIPLIVTPPVPGDPARMLRSQDLTGLILEIAGGATSDSRDTSRDELFVSEMVWQTYRRGRWKSMRPRERNEFYPHMEEYFRPQTGGPLFLFDLLEDPDEQRDVAALHPEVAEEHGERLRSLSEELAGQVSASASLSPEDEARLRVLGYLDDE